MDATLSKTIQLPEKPHGGPFRQQRLAAWQLTYTPASLMITYSVFFIVTLAFGIAITITYVRTVEVEVPYSSVQSCSYEDQVLKDISASLEGSSSPIFAPSGCEPIEIPFTINENMRQPVLMYYKLSNYFHNFFALTNSRDDNQLAGGTATESRCDPFYKIDERVISPCGALAWSLFNDTFRVFRLVENSSSTSDSSPLKRELICDTSSFDAHNEPIGVNVNTHCRKNGIAWRSDINTRFRPAPEDDDTIVTFRGVPSASNIFERFGWYANENGHSIPDVSDQDLMVWIHPSTRSTFQKNFRFFDMDLPAGNYLLEVTQRYPTSDFNGGKTIGFVEVPWTRTRYLTMGIVNIVLAGIGVFWFVVFASLHCVGITSNDSNKLNLAASQRF